MKLSYSAYTLLEKGTGKPKEGALVRVQLTKDHFGYGDIHPCESHGDKPLKEQLGLLSNRETTLLTMQSLLFAKYDALARSQKHNLFKNFALPESNTLIVNDTQNLQDAFRNSRMVKVKVGREWQPRIQRVMDALHIAKAQPRCLRLDFSESLTEESFVDFLAKNQRILPYIDYIEDPYPYDAQQWENSRRQYGVRLGCDHHASASLTRPDSCDVVIIKPATFPINDMLFRRLRGRRLVITSYLDHPLGQLTAAYVAGCALRSYPAVVDVCGLTTHEVFDPTPFSKRLSVVQGHLIPPKTGHGFGFDDLLEGATWNHL